MRGLARHDAIEAVARSVVKRIKRGELGTPNVEGAGPRLVGLRSAAPHTSRTTDEPSRSRTTLSVEERVQVIIDIMNRDEFRRGRTVKRLAKLWGLSVNRVRRLSAEASRRVRVTVRGSDVDYIESQLIIALERGIRTASVRNDWRALVALADRWTVIARGLYP